MMQHYEDTANTITVKYTKGHRNEIKHRKKYDIWGIKYTIRKYKSTLNYDNPAKV